MYDDIELIVKNAKDLDVAKAYLSDLGPKARLAIDTETCGKKGIPLELRPALRLDSAMLGFSVSKNRDSGIFVPFFSGPAKSSIWTVQQLLDIKNWMYPLFCDKGIGWVFHHAIFDLIVLRRHIGRPRNVVFDTQMAAHELDENRSIALKDLGAAMYGIDAKAEMNEMFAWAAANPEVMGTKPGKDSLMGQLYKVPLDLYGKYAIKDTKLTYALYEDFGAELVKRKMTKRYKWKNSLIPIYEEINSTGWAIDEQILSDVGKKMYQDITELFGKMHSLLENVITEIELVNLNKSFPIEATPTWKKRIIAKEGLERWFTGKDGKITLGQKMVDKFLSDPESEDTLTSEILQWNGLSTSTLSAELRQELEAMQRTEFVSKRMAKATEDDKVPCPYVFNFGSDQQISQLLFERLGLPILKTTEKSGAPDVSEEVLTSLKKQLEKENNRPEIVEFLGCLLQLRELEKLFGTYVIGIQKRLYTHEDLGREPEINPATGNVVKYCVSHVNMTGTVTGRPSSSDPNQLNFPKDQRIKSAFVAVEGYSIGSADYDAQEVRQATNIALDEDMKGVFTVICEACKSPQPEDIRHRISLDVYDTLKPEFKKKKDAQGNPVLDEKGKPIEEMTRAPHTSICCPVCKKYEWSEPDPHSLNCQRIYPECADLPLKVIKKTKKPLRDNAKVVGFQTLYGGTAAALSDALHISKAEAQAIQDAFFKGAPRIKEAIERTIREARARGYVETIGGYRRHLPDLNLEQLDYVKWPELDEETKGWKCFAKVDHHPEVDSNGRTKRMSNMECPRAGKCPFKDKCDHGFKRSMANKLKARAERQAFNCQIQGDSADVTNTALLNIATKRAELAKLNPAWNKLKIVSNIYDAIYLKVPEELCPKDPHNDPEERNYIKVLKWAMENTFPNLFVPLTAAMEAPVKSWAECH